MKHLILVLVSLLLLVSCGDGQKDYDLYIYNSKGENSASFEKMAAEYEAATGVRMKVFSIGSGQDHMETLRSEMNSKNKPSIFAIQGLKELIEWEEGGFVMDLANATEPNFVRLANDIPNWVRLTTDGKNSYGVPYNVEGFGFIVDKQMLLDLFNVSSVDNILADLKESSWGEFKNFVVVVDNYIKSSTPANVILNGNAYSLRSNKTGLANNLTGIFAVMGAEKWTYTSHAMAPALNTVFVTPYRAFNTTPEELEKIRKPVIQYMEFLDMKTSYLAGKSGAEKRGAAFVASANYGYDPTVSLFVNGHSLLLKQGNWAYGNIRNADKDMVQRLDFIPVKMPFTEDVVIAEGYDVKKMNTSIPVFVPNYYAINTRVSDEERLEAQKFLVWLNTTETGQKYVVDEFNFIPYNADPNEVQVENSLGNSIIQYMASGKTQNSATHGVPGILVNTTMGDKLMEGYMTKENWTKQDYEDIADYLIKSWNEELKR